MAAQFAKGQEVRLVVSVPQGQVQALRMDEDGNILCLLSWTDLDGRNQSRWFLESQLEAV